jgi:predicted ester cyclase
VTTPEQAKAVIRRWNDEGWSGGRYELADELIAPVMTVHGAGGQEVGMGPAGLVELIRTWRTAFPDGRMTVDDLIVEGDLVGIRNTWHGTHTGEFYGIPPTGRQVDVTSIGLDRVKDGQVVEGWGELDMVGMMQQLGALPAAGPGAVSAGLSAQWGPAQWGPAQSTAGEQAGDPADHKALLASLVQALASGDTSAAETLVDAGAFRDHHPSLGSTDWAGAQAAAQALRTAFPDLAVSLERDTMVCEGDAVLGHYLLSGTHAGELYGAAPTGRTVTWAATDFVRVSAGRVVERWVAMDTLTLFQQTGLLPGG